MNANAVADRSGAPEAAFGTDLRRAVDVARWAPSSHNCQPWQVVHLTDSAVSRALADTLNREAAEHEVVLALDPDRELHALPTLEHEMYISAGLFLSLLGSVLVHLGYRVDWAWLSDGLAGDSLSAVERRTGWTPLAVLYVNSGGTADARAFEHLADTAQARRTSRMPFADHVMDDTAIAELLRDRNFGPGSGSALSVTVERRPEVIAPVGALVRQYAALDFADYGVWKETYRYMRFDTTRAYQDGFYLQSLMGPMSPLKARVMKLVFAPPVMQALRPVGLPRQIATQLGDLVAGTRQLLVCSLPRETDKPKALTEAGMRLMDVWLNAQEQGVVMHPVSVMLQHDHAREALEKTLGVDQRIVFFARIGYVGQAPSPSPRRAAKGIVHEF